MRELLVENIKEICKQKNLTVLEVEKAAGLPKNSLYKWDRNRPAYTKVMAVASVLEVPVEELCR